MPDRTVADTGASEALIVRIAPRSTVARCAALAVGILVLGGLGAELRPPDSHVAFWWPAAALSVASVALAARRQRAWLGLTILVASTFANQVTGTPWPLSVAYGVANAAEAWVVALVLERLTTGRIRLQRLGDAARLVLAAATGALVAAVLVALGVAELSDGDPGLSGRSVAFSHTSAVVILAPLLMLGTPRTRSRTPPLEVVAQLATFLGVSALVFGPQSPMGLTFLHGPVLLWALARLSARACLSQVTLLALFAATATLYGWGPFPVEQTGSPEATVVATQLFIVAYGVSLTPLVIGMSELRTAVARTRTSERLYRSTFDAALAGALVVQLRHDAGPTLSILRQNSVAAGLLGGQQGRQDGAPWEASVVPEDRPLLMEAAAAVVSGQVKAWHGELRHLVEGHQRCVQVALTDLTWQSGEGTFLTAQLVDVTDRRMVEERLRELALHDHLTGLPNRSLLADRIAHALDVSRREGAGVALFFCDLDDFKVVNDTAGHASGDELLRSVAQRVVAAVRPGDTVARVGGDEFVVLSPGAGDPATAQRVAQRLLHALEQPVEVDGQVFTIGASIGIALSNPDSTAESLLRDADVAMYTAKSEGKSRATAYREEQSMRSRRRVQLEQELRQAVEGGELRLHVQPVIDLTTDAVVAGEVLLRWEHPTRGLLPPAEFLDVLETSPLIHEVGRWILAESCRLAAGWDARFGAPAPAVHVNVAARQLDRGELTTAVLQALDDSGLRPDRLVLELTETQLSRLDGRLLTELRAMVGAGVQLAADDFGTGYSSLTWLTDLPLGMLKIDRQFVASVADDDRARAVVQAVIGMGSALGLHLVAEGVDSPGQLQELHRLGCPFAQGFLWSRPVPPDQFVAVVAARLPVTPTSTPQP